MGCGESKHAVATTESVSQRKKLNSSTSKKIETALSSEPQQQTTPIDNKITNALPDQSAPKQPSPTSAQEPEKTVNVTFDDEKENNTTPGLEQNKEAGHDRTISQETQYENANDEKSVYESPQHGDVKEEDEVKKEEKKAEEVVKTEDEMKEEKKEEKKEEGKPEDVVEVNEEVEAGTTEVAATKEEEIAPAEEDKNAPVAQVPSA